MPTYARRHQLTRSLVYHVFNRSNNRVPIFNAHRDFLYFRNLLKKYGGSFDIKIYHWVIMNNHFHLLIEIEEPKMISSCMSGLARAYTHYYHKTYQTSGLLWQGRFKSQPIQKEKYLIACGRYIERNPVRANIVQEAHQYPYSSAGFYCLGENDAITTEDPFFGEFAPDVTGRKESYKKFLRDFNSEEERAFGNMEIPRGNKEFMRRLIKENGRYVPRRKGKPRKEILFT